MNGGKKKKEKFIINELIIKLILHSSQVAILHSLGVWESDKEITNSAVLLLHQNCWCLFKQNDCAVNNSKLWFGFTA